MIAPTLRAFAALLLLPACAGAPPQKPAAKVHHASPDGKLRILEPLPDEVAIGALAVGYQVAMAGPKAETLCIIGGVQQTEAGALLTSGVSRARAAWSLDPNGAGSRLIDPWTEVLGGSPSYGLSVAMDTKDGSTKTTPVLVAIHPVARVYCSESLGDVEALRRRVRPLLAGLTWEGKIANAPSQIYRLTVQRGADSGAGSPAGMLLDRIERGPKESSLARETLFATIEDTGDLLAVDFDMAHRAGKDGTLEEGYVARTINGERVLSAHLTREPNGDYRLTAAQGDARVDKRIPGEPKLYADTTIFDARRHTTVGAASEFSTMTSNAPWTVAMRVTLSGVAEDGRKSVRWEQEGADGEIVLSPDGVIERMSQSMGSDAQLLGELVR